MSRSLRSKPFLAVALFILFHFQRKRFFFFFFFFFFFLRLFKFFYPHTMSSRSITGRTAVITGASRGIGRAISLALAKEGVRVVLLARTREALEQTAQCCRDAAPDALGAAPNFAQIVVCDLSSIDAARDAATEALRLLDGRVDILINNAGMGSFGNFADADLDKFHTMMMVNFSAVATITHTLLPGIKASENVGAIIFISSVLGVLKMGGASGYCSSKHAIQGFAGSLFEDVREFAKVVSICPGYVATDMTASGKSTVPAKMIQPEDIAETVLYAIKIPDTACPSEIVIRPRQSPMK
jgi:3-oxoacyl-[acyl-carrier protein] reductase